VAYVWRDVLGVPRVGRQDEFFALGGRSLLLPRVRHRLEQELGVRLPLASLLERTTAAALVFHAKEVQALGERELHSAHTPKPVETILRLRHDPDLEQPIG
jgi:hypothetical protein